MNERNTLNLSATVFSAVIAAFYLLLLFLTDSFSSLWFVPLVVIFYLVTVYYTIKTDRQVLTPGVIWRNFGITALIIALFCLTSRSLDVSASLQRWTDLSFGLIGIAVFSICTVFDKGKVKYLYWGVAAVNLLFVALTLASLLFKDFANAFPTGSLVNFIQGQNHAYILYLYSLPLTIYYSLHSTRKWPWILMTSLFIIGVVLSFSRFGLFLLFAELAVILLWLEQSKERYLKAKWIQKGRKILVICLGLLVLYGVSFFFFSLFPQLSFGNDCKAPIFQTQICKTFSADGRPEYWKQALRGISNQPIWGNGGNTFGITSLQLSQDLRSYAFTPHNEYLQLVYEYGLIGVLLVAGYFVAILWAASRWKSLTDLTRIFLLTTCVGGLDALFNFNWSFSGIFFLECLWLAALLRRVDQETTSPKKSASNYQLPALIAVVVAFAPLIWLSSKYIFAELTSHENLDAYMKIFPYNSSLAQRAFQSNQLSEQSKSDILALHQNNAIFYQLAIDQHFDPQKQLAIIQKMITLDPRNSALHVRYMLAAVKSNNPGIVIEQEQWLLHFYDPTERYIVQEIDQGYLETLINYANALAATDPLTARDITVNAYLFQPWRVNEVETVFLSHPEKYSDSNLMYVLNSLPPELLWKYQSSIHEWTMSHLISSLEKENWSMSQQYLTLMLQYSDWEHWAIWGTLSPIYSRKIGELNQNDPKFNDKKKALLDAWRDGLATLKKFDTVGGTTNDIQKWSTEIESFAH